MDGIYKCIKESQFGEINADIQVLKKITADNERKIDKLKDKTDETSELNTAIKVMSVTLEHIVEHNKRQDVMAEKQNGTLEKINVNLSELSEGQRNLNHEQKNLNNKVAKLEQRVDDGEQKSIIDVRDINKENYISFLKKHAIPMGIGGGITMLILEILKILK